MSVQPNGVPQDSRYMSHTCTIDITPDVKYLFLYNSMVSAHILRGAHLLLQLHVLYSSGSNAATVRLLTNACSVRKKPSCTVRSRGRHGGGPQKRTSLSIHQIDMLAY